MVPPAPASSRIRVRPRLGRVAYSSSPRARLGFDRQPELCAERSHSVHETGLARRQQPGWPEGRQRPAQGLGLFLSLDVQRAAAFGACPSREGHGAGVADEQDRRAGDGAVCQHLQRVDGVGVALVVEPPPGVRQRQPGQAVHFRRGGEGGVRAMHRPVLHGLGAERRVVVFDVQPLPGHRADSGLLGHFPAGGDQRMLAAAVFPLRQRPVVVFRPVDQRHLGGPAARGPPQYPASGPYYLAVTTVHGSPLRSAIARPRRLMPLVPGRWVPRPGLLPIRKLGQQDPSAIWRASAPRIAGTVPAGSITERHPPLTLTIPRPGLAAVTVFGRFPRGCGGTGENLAWTACPGDGLARCRRMTSVA